MLAYLNGTTKAGEGFTVMLLNLAQHYYDDRGSWA